MSIGSVITLGLGSFSTVNYVPTLGYGDYDTPPPSPEIWGGRIQKKRKEDEQILKIIQMMAPSVFEHFDGKRRG
jgi:hypothetical protein